jgi:hypothetical protein
MRQLFQLFRSHGGARGHKPARPCQRLSLEALEDRLALSTIPSLGAAGQFGVLGLQNTQINNSNVYITGNEGVSQGGKLTNMAPSTITGNAVESSSGQYSGPGKLGGNLNIDPAMLMQAGTDALNASSTAAGLATTQTFGSITSPTTVTGNGGLNVIAVNGNIKSSLILSGTSSDIFIVNVTGSLSFSASSQLGLTGVTADHVLYNFTGASGTISSQVGNVLNGTLLAPKYSFNLDGAFYGEIIGGGKSIGLLSGAKVTQIPFSDASFQHQSIQATTLSGHVDAGNTGLTEVSVILWCYDMYGNVVPVMTTTPDSNGNYAFVGVAAGTYTISAQEWSGTDLASGNPVFYTFASKVGTVTSTNGTTTTIDGTVGSSGSGPITSIALNDGDQAVNYNFSIIVPTGTTATISGYVYLDTTLDGSFESSYYNTNPNYAANYDTGIAGVTIYLMDSSYNVLATTTTDIQGFYSFAGLAAGTYTITRDPTGYNIGASNVGTVNGVTDGTVGLGGTLAQIVLKSGDQGVEYDFGYTPQGT